jgi:hypothetical protein
VEGSFDFVLLLSTQKVHPANPSTIHPLCVGGIDKLYTAC